MTDGPNAAGRALLLATTTLALALGLQAGSAHAQAPSAPVPDATPPAEAKTANPAGPTAPVNTPQQGASSPVTGRTPATEASVAKAEANTPQVQEIVVTAQRRSEKLQDTPVAVSAFTSQALETRGVNNLAQIAQYTPSVLIQPTNRPGGGGSSIAAYIRGVGTGDYNIPTDPAIGVYIDGVYIARSLGGLMSLADIERVEVLKGPQGTLYGRNTLGGAISIVTEQPKLSGEPERLIEARAGTFGRKDIIASINSPIVEDKVAGKLSVAWLNSDGYGKDDYTGQRLSNEHRLIVRGALLFKLSDDLTLDLDADYTRQRQNPNTSSILNLVTGSPLVPLYNTVVAPRQDASLGLPAGTVFGSSLVPNNKYANYSASPLEDNLDDGGVAATLNWTPSNALQVKSITAVRSLQANIEVDGDQTPYNLVSEQTIERDIQESEELQVGGKVLDNRLNYIAGVFAFREVGHSGDLLDIFDGLYGATHSASLALDTHTFQRLEAVSYAVYTQETYTILPGLDATIGGRVNYDRKNYDAFVLAPQLGTVAIPDRASHPSWTSFTPKAGLDWKPTRDVMLYTSYAQGFKSGGISPPIVGLTNSAYSPEKLQTYEVGAKTEWFERRLTANFAAYYSVYDNIQLTTLVTLPNGSFGKPVENGGSADIYGYEAELVAVPIAHLTLNLSGAYTHDRFKSLAPGVVSALGAHVGERLPDIPDYNASAGAQYVFDLPFGSLLIRGDASVIGKSQLTIGDNTSFQNAYTLLNARIAFDPRAVHGLELAVDGTNLTNRLYFTYDQTQVTTDSHLVSPGAPAQIYASAKYRF